VELQSLDNVLSNLVSDSERFWNSRWEKLTYEKN